MNIFETLHSKSEVAKIALLIRHADRNKIPEGSFGDEIQLNTRGKQNAFNFGQKLANYRINKIYSSPVMRCVQTAKHLLKGYKKELQVEKSTILGSPGAYVYNEQLAGDYFLKVGFEAMYQNYISGEQIPGIRNEEGTEILHHFIQQNTQNEGITIFITHDIIIANYDFHSTGTIYTKENWIPFLGGIFMEFKA